GGAAAAGPSLGRREQRKTKGGETKRVFVTSHVIQHSVLTWLDQAVPDARQRIGLRPPEHLPGAALKSLPLAAPSENADRRAFDGHVDQQHWLHWPCVYTLVACERIRRFLAHGGLLHAVHRDSPHGDRARNPRPGPGLAVAAATPTTAPFCRGIRHPYVCEAHAACVWQRSIRGARTLWPDAPPRMHLCIEECRRKRWPRERFRLET